MGGVGETVPGDELVDEPEEAGATRCLLIGIADVAEARRLSRGIGGPSRTGL